MQSSTNTLRFRCALGAAIAALTGAVAPAGATVGIAGFSNGLGWTGNASPAPTPAFTATTVQLTTTGIENQASSAFFNTKQPVGAGFQAAFTYQQTSTADPNSPGDGVTFVVQNAGATALGGSGGNLGYQGIGSSLAVALDLNQGVPRHDTTGLGSGGNYADGNGFATAPLVMDTGHQISVTLNYNSVTGDLTENLQDLTTSQTFAHTYTGLNVAGLVGGSTAFVGFTGSTGQFDDTQIISNFTFTGTPVPEPATAAALSLGALGCLARRRRQRVH